MVSAGSFGGQFPSLVSSLYEPSDGVALTGVLAVTLPAESRALRGVTPPLSSEAIRVAPQYSAEVSTSKRSVEVRQALVNVVETRPVYQLKMAPAVPQYTALN